MTTISSSSTSNSDRNSLSDFMVTNPLSGSTLKNNHKKKEKKEKKKEQEEGNRKQHMVELELSGDDDFGSNL
eukprot:CAMPEP_0114357788 /NCGR_PEP_ID=MMETSP0101-20121206/21854_1 /TAXON_ID=38822 ORGANISM="Pteridomonas danica, Strain PT" /NCGR_SAMPLE_ID=MMETSP0101 /ASSEMBLY_ACC=CAM_ASM_000211 /LENGTH=71 /DNA_ID=CAMNT_0001500655 /DNA_START=625 /DNA_END=840 /DNA_ORIENTATION=-